MTDLNYVISIIMKHLLYQGVANDIFFAKPMKHRTVLRNPPYPPFSKGGITKIILLPPLKKGGRGDFCYSI